MRNHVTYELPLLQQPADKVDQIARHDDNNNFCISISFVIMDHCDFWNLKSVLSMTMIVFTKQNAND